MSERESLMAAIKATPNEDMPRLLLADWLDEYSDSDLDRARAEFIRLSCTMEHRKAARPAVGKWLDKNAGRLVPTLTAHLTALNADYNRVMTHDSTDDLEDYHRVMDAGRCAISRKGRNLELRLVKPGLLPELVTIEFWRGFVRKVTARHWHVLERTLLLVMPDQPLVEPGLSSAVRAISYRNPPLFQVYSGWIGPAFDHLTGNDKYKPDRIGPITGTPMFLATWAGTSGAERARWACAIAFRKAAEDVMAGRRRACEPMGMPVSPIAELGGEA